MVAMNTTFYIYDNSRERLVSLHGFSKRYETLRGASIAASAMNRNQHRDSSYVDKRYMSVDSDWMKQNKVTTSVPSACIPGTEAYMSA